MPESPVELVVRVRAASVQNVDHGVKTAEKVVLLPVPSSDPDDGNGQWAGGMPTGKVELTIEQPAAWGFFKPDGVYTLTVSESVAAPVQMAAQPASPLAAAPSSPQPSPQAPEPLPLAEPAAPVSSPGAVDAADSPGGEASAADSGSGSAAGGGSSDTSP